MTTTLADAEATYAREVATGLPSQLLHARALDKVENLRARIRDADRYFVATISENLRLNPFYEIPPSSPESEEYLRQLNVWREVEQMLARLSANSALSDESWSDYDNGHDDKEKEEEEEDDEEAWVSCGTGNFCIVCCDETSVPNDAHVSKCCGCVTCNDCLKQNIKAKGCIMPIPCPNEKCHKGSVKLEDVESIIRDDKKLMVLVRRLSGDEAAFRAGAIPCPVDACEGLVRPCRGPVAVCGTCKAVVCIPCRARYHENLTCDQYASLPGDEKGWEDIKFSEIKAEMSWMACPTCRRCVEKEPGGCPHIVCWCTAEFCYTCGALWNKSGRKCGNSPSKCSTAAKGTGYMN